MEVEEVDAVEVVVVVGVLVVDKEGMGFEDLEVTKVVGVRNSN